jgi:hypothetical protein
MRNAISQLFYGVPWGVSLWFLRAAENGAFLRDFQMLVRPVRSVAEHP